MLMCMHFGSGIAGSHGAHVPSFSNATNQLSQVAVPSVPLQWGMEVPTVLYSLGKAGLLILAVLVSVYFIMVLILVSLLLMG